MPLRLSLRRGLAEQINPGYRSWLSVRPEVRVRTGVGIKPILNPNPNADSDLSELWVCVKRQFLYRVRVRVRIGVCIGVRDRVATMDEEARVRGRARGLSWARVRHCVGLPLVLYRAMIGV